MKLSPSYRNRQGGGVAVMVMLAILSLMLVFIGANFRSFNSLDRELKLTEKRQLQRLDRLHSRTNAVRPTGSNVLARPNAAPAPGAPITE